MALAKRLVHEGALPRKAMDDKGAADLFERGRSRRVRQDLQARCLRRLGSLDQAEGLRGVNAGGAALGTGTESDPCGGARESVSGIEAAQSRARRQNAAAGLAEGERENEALGRAPGGIECTVRDDLGINCPPARGIQVGSCM